MDPMIGKQLGTYLIQEKLGEGGMARVYKAYHTRLHRDAAIKIISSHIAHDTDFQARFEREAQLIANLEHPNIVKVFDFNSVGDLTYLVMQYVGGGTLREQMREGQPLEPLRAAQYALQMARALHHAHLRGIVHRDVKPQNMLLATTDPNQLLLSDFGIAKIFSESQEATHIFSTSGSKSSDSALTNVNQIVGTADYMAPEQIQRRRVDARTDVYALGVVLFHMLTGRTPFHSTTLLGLLYQHVSTPPPSIHELNPHTPESLIYITTKALEKSPGARFQSAETMAQALEMALHPSTHLSSSFMSPQSFAGYTSMLPMNYSNPIYPQTTLPNSPIIAAPPQPGSSKGTRRTRIALGASLALVIVSLIIYRVFPSFATGGLPSNTAKATAFIDTFANNHLGWKEENNSNGLAAQVASGVYTISVTDENTYFPTPAQVGTLPANFTLSASIKQDEGSLYAVYGIAFRITYDGDQLQSGYAFVINSAGDYALFRYDNGVLNSLWRVQQSTSIRIASHGTNTLKAVITGSTFTFFVNDISAPPPTKTTTTFSDSTYTGGEPGLLVTGPHTSFSVTKVQLAIS